MTATLTIHGRHDGPVTIHDENTVRAIAEAVAAYNRNEGDRQFRVRRPSPSQHIRKSTVFKASEVATLNADGVDLTDLGTPFVRDERVAA